MLPELIKFDGECLIVLKHSVLAVRPKEGCALLLGIRHQHIGNNGNVWRIKFIWPCCNIWEREMDSTFHKSQEKQLSRLNRFVIDPREHINAQKWARANSLEILGSAHSHPEGEAIPSKIDRDLNFLEGLMVIIDKEEKIRCWWMPNDQTILPKELNYI